MPQHRNHEALKAQGYRCDLGESAEDRARHATSFVSFLLNASLKGYAITIGGWGWEEWDTDTVELFDPDVPPAMDEQAFDLAIAMGTNPAESSPLSNSGHVINTSEFAAHWEELETQPVDKRGHHSLRNFIKTQESRGREVCVRPVAEATGRLGRFTMVHIRRQATAGQVAKIMELLARQVCMPASLVIVTPGEEADDVRFIFLLSETFEHDDNSSSRWIAALHAAMEEQIPGPRIYSEFDSAQVPCPLPGAVTRSGSVTEMWVPKGPLRWYKVEQFEECWGQLRFFHQLIILGGKRREGASDPKSNQLLARPWFERNSPSTWQVSAGGDSRVVEHSTGMAMIRYLVAHAGEQVSASALQGAFSLHPPSWLAPTHVDVRARAASAFRTAKSAKKKGDIEAMNSGLEAARNLRWSLADELRVSMRQEEDGVEVFDTSKNRSAQDPVRSAIDLALARIKNKDPDLRDLLFISRTLSCIVQKKSWIQWEQ